MKTPLFNIGFEFDDEANWHSLELDPIPETYAEAVLMLHLLQSLFDAVQQSIPEDYQNPYKTIPELHSAILELRKKRLQL